MAFRSSGSKAYFFDYYTKRFKLSEGVHILHRSPRFKALEVSIPNKIKLQLFEVKVRPVFWLCGGNRAPGSDGFSFRFLKKKVLGCVKKMMFFQLCIRVL